MSWLNIGHPSQKKTKNEKASIHISHNKLATDRHIDLTSPDLTVSGQASILAVGNYENPAVNPRGDALADERSPKRQIMRRPFCPACAGPLLMQNGRPLLKRLFAYE